MPMLGFYEAHKGCLFPSKRIPTVVCACVDEFGQLGERTLLFNHSDNTIGLKFRSCSASLASRPDYAPIVIRMPDFL